MGEVALASGNASRERQKIPSSISWEVLWVLEITGWEMGRRDACPTPQSLGHSEKLSSPVQRAVWGQLPPPSPVQPAQWDGREMGRGSAETGTGLAWQQGLNR